MQKECPLNEVAQSVAASRYYRKNESGEHIEDWNGLVNRVVEHVCKKESSSFKQKVFDLIYATRFLPNSPCLVNSGTNVGGLLACFVTKSPEDSWLGFMENIANFGHIARRGGGCGVDFSNIRPEGEKVAGSTHYRACGPIRHMIVVAEAMNSITQSGFRGMANMGVLRVDHPDIMKFIVCKQRDFALKYLLKEDIFRHFDQLKGQTTEQTNIVLDKFLSNFNISVLVTDKFMKAVEDDGDFDLVFKGKVYETLKARKIFDAIVKNAWKNGDPGILFYDAVNNGPYKYSGQKITATNPCGEQPLPQFASCNLGSIDIAKFYDPKTNDVNWNALREAIRISVQFLDNVIDANMFPTPEFEQWAKDNRPIGLGVMGLADLLMSLGLAYGSPDSLAFAEKLMKFFKDVTHEKSVELGKERGTPKACNYKELDYRRNVTTLTIAPTGSISLLAGCNGSIEPFFSSVTMRFDNTGQYEIPCKNADMAHFRCAVDKLHNGEKEVKWHEHVDMQIAFQKYVDSAISKTINMPNSATEDDVYAAYMRAWKGGCKGITIYRDKCKTTQVLNTDRKTILFGSSEAMQRPKEIECDIHRTIADGQEWHVIVGKVDSQPYEIFAVNGKCDLPKDGRVIKRKKHHYTLVDENDEVLIDNLNDAEEEIDGRLGLETRRFSLELRHGIPPKFIVQQIDKSSAKLTSFSKAVSRVLKKYLSADDIVAVAENIYCEKCAEKGLKTEMEPGSSCMTCPRCHFSRCG